MWTLIFIDQNFDQSFAKDHQRAPSMANARVCILTLTEAVYQIPL